VPPAEDKSRIDELNTSLYSRMAPDVRTRRKLRFDDSSSDVKTDWEHRPEDEPIPEKLNPEYKKSSMSFFTKLLIFSILFCVVAVGLGAYLFFNGSNLISANNIDIAINGPVSIAGGSPITFDIVATNKNNVDLQTVDMNVDFPAGTTDPNNPGTVLGNYRKLLGDMPAGSSAHQTVQAIMFGEENTQKEIVVTLTYSVKGSTAVFTKTQSYDVLVSSAPITVTADSFKEITSGQALDIKVQLKSNSADTLKNVLLKASYPFGLSFVSASLLPGSDNATWKIGDIPPGGDRVVTIHGTLTGEDSDLRAFHFSVGAANPKDPKSIATEYVSIEQDVTIQKPFISLNVSIDGDTGAADHVGKFGGVEHVTVNWANNLPDTVSNMQIDAKLSGSAYDKTTVTPDGGYFDSANNDVIWSTRTNPEFASVAAGSNGTVSFSIIPRDLGTPSQPIVNPSIAIVANVAGKRTQESQVPQDLKAALTRNIHIASNVALSGRIVRGVGPFTNSGPIPPKVDQTTTYTIIWDVDNTSSAAGNAVVTATLPPYMTWLNNISPSSENVIYDKNTGNVTWNIGNVSAYTMNTSHRREVAFQVSFKPNTTQVGQSPTIVGKSTLTATDGFTNAQLESDQDVLTSRFSTDPTYRSGSEVVTK